LRCLFELTSFFVPEVGRQAFVKKELHVSGKPLLGTHTPL
jgi:hypothetical protein